MKNVNVQLGAKQASSFLLAYFNGYKMAVAEVYEINMDGWTLYECFSKPSYNITYFGWDDGAALPEWIDMDNKELTEAITLLGDAIINYKKIFH